MHYQWNYEPPTPERQQAIKELAEKINMSPIVADLLISRGIKTFLQTDDERTHRSFSDERYGCGRR